MKLDSQGGRAWRCAAIILALSVVAPGSAILADTILMKNGQTFLSIGPPDRDGTLVFLWDGLKKTVVRDSKIERIDSDGALRTGEKFQLVQPLIVHAGVMPKEVLQVEA